MLNTEEEKAKNALEIQRLQKQLLEQKKHNSKKTRRYEEKLVAS